MAFIKSNLINSIRSINDEKFGGFLEFPEDVSEAAERWSLAIGNYAALVTPPSTTFEAARQALKSKLSLADSLEASAFTIGLSEYASILSLGMQPAFTGTPPITPIAIEPVFSAGFAGASAEEVANQLGEVIDLWFKTGTAINNVSGATVTWI